jgi:hypothetical protein
VVKLTGVPAVDPVPERFSNSPRSARLAFDGRLRRAVNRREQQSSEALMLAGSAPLSGRPALFTLLGGPLPHWRFGLNPGHPLLDGPRPRDDQPERRELGPSRRDACPSESRDANEPPHGGPRRRDSGKQIGNLLVEASHQRFAATHLVLSFTSEEPPNTARHRLQPVEAREREPDR